MEKVGVSVARPRRGRAPCIRRANTSPVWIKDVVDGLYEKLQGYYYVQIWVLVRMMRQARRTGAWYFSTVLSECGVSTGTVFMRMLREDEFSWNALATKCFSGILYNSFVRPRYFLVQHIRRYHQKQRRTRMEANRRLRSELPHRQYEVPAACLNRKCLQRHSG